MSDKVTFIHLPFADGVYRFHLPIPQVEELEEKCGNCGVFAIYGRLQHGRYTDSKGEGFGNPGAAIATLRDVRETIRLGLIGGGGGVVDGQPVAVTPVLAKKLVDRYGPPARPFDEGWSVAAAILFAAIEGVPPPEQSDAEA